MYDTEQIYKKMIANTYSSLSYARLSNPGELIDRSFSLQDIFFPTKFTSAENYENYSFLTAPEQKEKEDRVIIAEANKELIKEILEIAGYKECNEEDSEKTYNVQNASLIEKILEDIEEMISTYKRKEYVSSISLSEKKVFSNEELIQIIINLIDNELDKSVQNAEKGRKNVYRRMIIGKPGSGKSTYIRRMALAYATDEYEFIQKNNWKVGLFPIVIQLKTLSLFVSEEKSIEDYIGNDFVDFLYRVCCHEIREFSEQIDDNIFKDIIREKIKEGSLCLLVDSFDEIDEQNRYCFIKKLREFLCQNELVNIYICSREGSFDLQEKEKKGRVTEELYRIPFLKYQSVRDLSDNDIISFVNNWFNVVFPNDIKNEIKINKIIKILCYSKNPYIDKIKIVPLYLSNILCLARNTGDIPRSKDDFLAKFIELCLNSSLSEYNEYDNLVKQLSYLAYKMSVMGKKLISSSDVRMIFKECYQELSGVFRPELPLTDIDHYIDRVLLQCNRGDVFKVCRTIQGEDIYQFVHLQIQEYFTAYAINKLYCPGVTRRTIPLDIIEPYLGNRGWKEILIMVISMEKQRWGAEEYVEKILELYKKEEDNYYYSNILFEIATNNENLSKEMRSSVYEALFIEHITDKQIRSICEGVENSTLPGEFLCYIRNRFEESLSTENVEFVFVNATVLIEQSIVDMVSPFSSAIRRLFSSDVGDKILGLYMISVIAWCKYCDINITAIDYTFDANEELVERILTIIESDNILSVEAACVAIKDMVIAGYLVDKIDLWKKILEVCVKNLGDEKKQKHIRKIISVVPISYLSIAILKDAICETYGSKLVDDVDSLIEKNKTDEYVFSFAECILMHRWTYLENELLDQVRIIQAKVLVEKNLDDATKIRMRQIVQQTSKMTNPISEAFMYYSQGKYDYSKMIFMLAWDEQIDVKTNLAYMLRRKEIESVFYDGHEYTVDELLESGIASNDATAIMNKALLISSKNNVMEYQVGMDYLRTKKDSADLEITFSWWSDRANMGEKEGSLVLLWLLDLGVINEDSVGYGRDILLTIVKDYVINVV